MKTQNSRIEELEKKDAPEKRFYVIKEVLDVRSFNNEKLFKYEDEEKLMTEKEAEERFTDGDLFTVVYSNKWKSQTRKAQEIGDL